VRWDPGKETKSGPHATEYWQAGVTATITRGVTEERYVLCIHFASFLFHQMYSISILFLFISDSILSKQMRSVISSYQFYPADL
jgi:hypothetical protein